MRFNKVIKRLLSCRGRASTPLGAIALGLIGNLVTGPVSMDIARAQTGDVAQYDTPAAPAGAEIVADPISARLDAAQAAFDRGEYGAVVQNCREVLERDAGSVAAINLLMEALRRSGRSSEALAEADRLIPPSQTNSVLRSQRGFLRRNAGRIDEAAADFRVARSDPALDAAQRATLDAALAETAEAIIQRDVQRDLAAAQSAYERNDPAAAETAARRVLAQLPRSEPATRLLVDTLSRAGKSSEALAVADAFVAGGAVSPEFRAARGYIRRQAGQLVQAQEDFRAALADPKLADDVRRNAVAALAEAEAARIQEILADGQRALDQERLQDAIDIAREVAATQPKSAPAQLLLSTALARANRVREAISQLDAVIAGDPERGSLYAQRAYYKRRLQDLDGARADFVEALNRTANSDEAAGVKAAVAEIDAVKAGKQMEASQALLDEGRRNVERLVRARRFGEALKALSVLMAADVKGWMLVQRGSIYREQRRYGEAAGDFRRALRTKGLDPGSANNVRFLEADSRAEIEKGRGHIEEALAIYRAFVAAYPHNPEGWYRLGYLLLAQQRYNEAGAALVTAIAIRPTTTAYLDAAGTFILTDAPLASRLYRQGLDGVAQRKPEDPPRTPQDIERIQNDVVKADNSARVSVGMSGIAQRPLTAGGSAFDVGTEAAVRFDGRYLPAIEGLEAYARFYHGHDQTGFGETDIDAGVRWRPFRDIDFYVGGAFLQRFEPDVKSQIALNWGIGLGGAAYPYLAEVETAPSSLYWDFAALGTYRTADARYLQDVYGNIGMTFGGRSGTVKTSIGPMVMAIASLDSAASDPWAFGAGPTVMGRVWLGGDNYRAYDALVQFQVGYLFAIGDVKRQEGWRGKIILYY